MPAAVKSLSRNGFSISIFQNAQDACGSAGDQISALIRESIEAKGRAALGLATGNTPLPVYERLVSLHRAGELQFSQVCTYNLDEYYPISPADPRSYRMYMHQHILQHVDLPANQAHLLDGSVPSHFAAAHCSAFDGWIQKNGGLDLQLLGIGRNGHIGFNEPADITVSEALSLPSRLVHLHPMTRADAAADFGGNLENVPTTALTVGVATILSARWLIMLALGHSKAHVVAQAILGPMTAQLPASLLQSVSSKVVWLLDQPAAAGLL